MPSRVRDKLPPSRRQYVPQPVPEFLEFQHPKLVAQPPAGPHWLHEVKLDGYRLQIRVERGRPTIYTRRGLDWTDQLPELAADAAALPDCILDGELCFLDPRGRPTFSGLRSAIGRKKTAPLVFFAFDLLWRGQDDLRTFALEDRKDILSGLIADADPTRIRYVEPLPFEGSHLMTAACRMGLEGIVSKRRASRYVAGRGEGWVKSKCHLAQEFVIGAWVQEPGRHLKGVLVGVHGPKGLTYVGSLERGFSAAPDLLKRLELLSERTNPFKAGDPPRPHAHWVRPVLVCEAEFQEWTASGKIRHATFKGLRDDKEAREVRRERAEDAPL